MVVPQQHDDPLVQAYAAYQQLEGRLSTAMDSLVATNGFAELFTSSATSLMAVLRIVNGTVDQAVRATRLAARQDITGLARQLARTEDKLERLLQAVEQLEARLDALSAERVSPAPVSAEPVTVAPVRPVRVSPKSANGAARRVRST